MTKKTQLITIDIDIYLKLLQNGILKNRGLSELLNTFLKNYLSDNKKYSDLFNKKIELEEELKKLDLKSIKISSELTKVTQLINEEKKTKEKQAEKNIKEVKIRQQVIKNSGILDDIGM